MKNMLLIIILSAVSITQLFALDASIGIKTGLSTDPDDWGNSWSTGLYLEVGLLKDFSIVIDSNTRFKSLYYLTEDNNDTTIRRRTSRSGSDFSLLSKIRYGNAVRTVVALGPSMQMTKDFSSNAIKKNRHYDFLGFTALVGVEADLGPGYFFTNLTYAGYLNFSSTSVDNSVTLTYNDYRDSFKVYVGYAIRFRNDGYDGAQKKITRPSSSGAMNMALST